MTRRHDPIALHRTRRRAVIHRYTKFSDVLYRKIREDDPSHSTTTT